ncbi:hypothetical protein I3843_14G011300 [Carya illinoinensis]|nr:hypothetical protein I3843_14G011300 [Carya illinoinensis]
MAPHASSSFRIMLAFVFLWCFGSLITFVVGRGNETDRLALLDFKANMHDPLGVLSSWNDSIHFCRWQGVSCGRRQHQRVTKLDLQSQNLGGFISPQLGNLSFLKELNLLNNSFIHTIPPEVSLLRRLQVLELGKNSVNGQIPSNISGCTNLIYVGVHYNQLVGEIPAELASLSKLRWLYIYNNKLAGSIPSSFGNLSSLEVLDVVFNELSGSIPDSFGQLQKLTSLSLGSNRFSGTFPPSIFNLSSITVFDVGYNRIQGSLPWDLGVTLPNLKSFNIFVNQFTGSIPVSIANASHLYDLKMHSNKLTGKVPSLEMLYRLQKFVIHSNLLGNSGGNDLSFLCSLKNATDLSILAIGSNKLGGVLPNCIGNFSTTLSRLLLRHNRIFGSIPKGIGNLINLEKLDMAENTISGNIPSEIGYLEKLITLDLSTNNHSGNIPPSLGNLTLLVELNLGGNNLRGRIPQSLAKCQNLLSLVLSRNKLSGVIPPQVMGLSFSPIDMDLSENLFTGILPMEIGNLKNLESLIISANKLFGEIPASLGNCVELEVLAMRKNFFQGSIPSSFESLRGIELLDLSYNNLSGEIPNFLEHFNFLHILDLSYNHFRGQVPTRGVFNNASGTSVKGNGELCGGITEFQLRICKHEKSNKRRKLTLTLKLVISILSGLLGVTLVLLCLLISLKKKRKENSPKNSENLLLNVSYQSLLKATDGFSSTNLIGVGSFGSVYKGILDQGTSTIAVKVLNLLRHGASESFITECEALRNIRHRNLVKVLTACSSVDYQGHDFKALVYELMENGNLDEWLHPTPRTNEASRKQQSLSLLQRLDIATDIASAMEYLHHHCATPIVHCDLKPGNVLLDEEMTAHVGDFGLARFLIDITQDYSIDHSISIGVKGTVGYAPPEYGMGNEVSTNGDVYSYGILLLEMFTGKRPTDDMFKDDFSLHEFVKGALPERLVDVVDPVLLWEREDHGASRSRSDDASYQSQITSSNIQECLSLILGVGVACSMELPKERMNIKDVLAELHSIREKNFLELVYTQRKN